MGYVEDIFKIDALALEHRTARVCLTAFKLRRRALCNKLADADGYVTFHRWARLLLAMVEKSPEDWLDDNDGWRSHGWSSAQRMYETAKDKALAMFLFYTDEGGNVLSFERAREKMLASELVSILERDLHGNEDLLSKFEAAVLAIDRVSDAHLADAAAFAAADEDQYTQALKKKVVALCQAVAGESKDGFTKDQLLKYALGLAQSGKLAVIRHLESPCSPSVPEDSAEQMKEMIDDLFLALDKSFHGKVDLIDAYAYALQKICKHAHVTSFSDMGEGWKMRLFIPFQQYADIMLSAASASVFSIQYSGADRLAEVTKLFKDAFDATDLNGNGFLDKDKLRAGCLVMAQDGEVSAEEGMCELEPVLDGFIAQADPEGTGQVSFEAMLAVALPGLCQGEDPEEFFAKMDSCYFSTIKMQIDMYLGGFSKK